MVRWFLVLIMSLLLCAISFAFNEEEHIKNGPSEDFIKGFDAGVKWGALAFINTGEDDIPTLTKTAKRIYWLIEVDKGKTLIDMIDQNESSASNPSHESKDQDQDSSST